ncbi:MAG TPA: hypothetical protein VHF51_15835 [Solirubrobacteraceae bacterium]|nr:hypothetical protein [Solirubrobacteraceae bacterium]
MPENEARAWWADVQHVRESIERRRGGVVDSAPRAEPAEAGRFARGVAEPPASRLDDVPRLDDLDWPAEVPDVATRRFARSGAPERSDRTATPPDDPRLPRRRSAGATDADRGTRRHAATATEADRASARGRRPRTGTEVSRTRSQRGDAAPARAERVAESSGRATPAGELQAGGADATGRRAAVLDFGVGGTPAADRTPARPPAARRTVQITGRTVAAPPLPRLVEVERRRPGRRPAERVGPRPDRIALYAVLLGFFLILVAATSAHAAI